MHFSKNIHLYRSRRKAGSIIRLLALLAIASSSHAQTIAPSTVEQEVAQTVELQDVTVVGAVQATEEKAKEKLDEVAGGTSLIKSTEVERGRASTAADVLAYQPGVFAQSAGGNDALRISIRGSGINRGVGSFREGINFLFDGLPVTGPGGTPFELFEPLGLQYTEVLRGGNGFLYGPTALGGAINYVTYTGFDAHPIELRAEAGSYSYYKGQIASGLVLGPADYYVSLTGSYRNGFQDHSESVSVRLATNIGYQISDNVSTRFFVRYGYTNFQQPGNLTLNGIYTDPRGANPANVALNARRVQPGSVWVANKTTVTIDDHSTFEIGGVYHDYPIVIGGGELSNWWDGDLSFVARYTRNDEIFGKQNKLTLGVITSYTIYGGEKTYGNNPATAQFKQHLKTVDYSGSSNTTFLINDEFEVIPNLWLTAGLAVLHFTRDSDITFPVTNNYSREVTRLAPRVGAIYDVLPNVQLYGNFTRTTEPADSWKYSGGSGSGQLFNRDLREQNANTVELGARATSGPFQGSLTIYRSWIKNELLNVQVAPGPPPVTANSNASPTIHQGIELGLDTVLWQESNVSAGSHKETVDKNVEAPEQPHHRIVLRQAYTLNDFYYENDPIFGDNQLPGLPEHYYQGELIYEHPSGFYAGFNAQAASSYDLDYANTVSVPSYVIFGAKIGYLEPEKGWEIYADFRNLTDKRYVTAVTPVFNAGGADVAQFQPGDGFSVFGGVSYRF